MEIYTKKGDAGLTSLQKQKNIAKSDDRIQLVGNLEELISHIGTIKCRFQDPDRRKALEEIQQNLRKIIAQTGDPYEFSHRLKEEEVGKLEQEMDVLKKDLPPDLESVLPGENALSASIDLTRAAARRCERFLSLVAIRYGADSISKKYLNRLGDYFLVLARSEGGRSQKETEKPAVTKTSEVPKITEYTGERFMEQVSEQVIQEVLKRLGGSGSITLSQAKCLMEKVEAFAETKGLKAVLAVCGPEGTPIAVHVMDGAFLVSFDVAVKKAWTSASVKMSTLELGKLTGPGGTFQGLDRLQGDKMVFFGGGIPLKVGERLIGALGVSGGTGEQDDEIARYGLSILTEILA